MTLRLCKNFFGILCLGMIFANCADLRDVFDSGDRAPSQSSSTTRQKKKPSEKSAKQSSSQDKPKKIKKTKAEPEVAVDHSVPDDPSVRRPITTKEGVYYFVASGDTLAGIAEKYKISGIALAHVNDMLYESTLSVGRRLFIPHKNKLSKYVSKKDLPQEANKKTKKTTVEAESVKNKKTGLIWPTEKGEITSGFGMRHGRPHNGIDIGVPSGTPIFAVADGEVLHAEYFSSYGNLVLIKHKNGYYSAYAHNRKILVKKGQKVKQGQTIAESGKTGRASGPHLHFEIHKKGGAEIDPMTMLPKR